MPSPLKDESDAVMPGGLALKTQAEKDLPPSQIGMPALEP